MPAASWLPFSHWNLRYNPFGELTIAERASVAVFDPLPFVELLQSGRVAIQFIGGCGRGKSTRLLTIRHALNVAPSASVCLPPYAALMPPWWVRLWRLHGNPLIIDEAQRIPWPVRARIFSRDTSLVLGTHRDLTRQLRWAGYQVVTERVGPGNDTKHLRSVVNARLQAARLMAGDVPELSLAEAEALIDRFGDDLRAAEGFLYHQVQRQASGDGQMRFID